MTVPAGSAWLRQLVAEATNESQALLDMFAHDSACEWIADHSIELALICADMGDALGAIAEYIECLNPELCGGTVGTCRVCSGRKLLARVAALAQGNSA